MVARIWKNLGYSLPPCLIFGLWLAFAEGLRVTFGSPKLFASTGGLALVLAYGYLSTLAVILLLSIAISKIVSLFDPKDRLGPHSHAGRVMGILVFLVSLIGCGFFVISRAVSIQTLDPRFIFPVLGMIVGGILLGRLTAVLINRTYDPSNWASILVNHYSLLVGLSVFIFGTTMAHYYLLGEGVYRNVSVVPTIENALFYPIFIVAGALALWLIHFILVRVQHRSGLLISVILLFTFIPLAIFLRPAEADNPGKHNPKPGDNDRNIILISIDTLRYDRLGCNFNDHIETPNIDALAEEGILFDNCIVPMPVTIPSHYSMLTGLNPRNHGVRVQNHPLDAGYTTISEILSDEGFTCGGFVSMSLLSGASSELDRDFHYYDDYWIYRGESKFFPPEVKYFIARRIINKLVTGQGSAPNVYSRRAEDAVDSVLGWLDRVDKEDFFCFLHLFDPHWDYNAPEPYTAMYDQDYDGDIRFHFYLNKSIQEHKLELERDDFEHIMARYDGEVTYTDAQLGRLFESLKERGLWDETMIILTSDHGESFEHRYFFGHSLRVYQSCIHIPLIIKPFGGARGKRVGALCSNTDLLPTICEVVGFDIPDGLDGVSLAGLLNGTASKSFKPHQFLFSESYPYGSGIQNIGRTYSIVSENGKLIYSPYAFPFEPIYQLYNLNRDPDEEKDIYDSQPDLAETLFSLLDKWVKEDKAVEQGAMGQIERETLKSLQYLH